VLSSTLSLKFYFTLVGKDLKEVRI